MEHEAGLNIYFNGELLSNVIRADLLTLDSGIGSIVFELLPGDKSLKNLIGRSGPLVIEVLDNFETVWKYSREVLFYPASRSYLDKGRVFTSLDYRLVVDNKIDNMAAMLGDMKRRLLSFRAELDNVNVTGGIRTKVNDLLNRLDVDEEKLLTFEDQHFTTRKRLISDYGFSMPDRKKKWRI